MNEMKNWYVVYTRTRCEKKVAGILSRKKIENFFPMNRICQHAGSDRKKITYEPLFKACVFVKVSELEHAELKETEGVINMVYWLGKPVIVTEAEINLLINFSGEFNNIKLEKRPIQSDARPMLIDKLMDEYGFEPEGVKTKITSITLPSLGYTLQAKSETGNIKLINSENPHNYSRSESISV